MAGGSAPAPAGDGGDSAPEGCGTETLGPKKGVWITIDDVAANLRALRKTGPLLKAPAPALLFRLCRRFVVARAKTVVQL